MTGATLRRREDGAIELRVNGVFVMDDRETSSERRLATAALGLGARDVLVGGLGLGFTLRELLASPQVDRVVVAELHPEIVGWMRDGTIAGRDLLDDPRTGIVVDDVRAVVEATPETSLDAILLDVDNGPDFLVHDDNAAVYARTFVDVCAARLRSEGHLLVWSMARSDTVMTHLAAAFAEVAETAVDVRLQGRDERYWILTGSRPRRSDIVPV